MNNHNRTKDDNGSEIQQKKQFTKAAPSSKSVRSRIDDALVTKILVEEFNENPIDNVFIGQRCLLGFSLSP